jgi:FkbM family methyltransferase
MPIETLVGLFRQWPFRGKGRVFSPLVSRRGVREVAVWGHYRMPLDLSDVVQRQMFLGCFGYEIAATIRALLPPRGCFLDVGAHAGYFTLLAAHRVGPSGQVFAVEPNPAMFERLERVVRANGLTTCRPEAVALTDRAGSLSLYVPPDAENRPHNVTAIPQAGWREVTVPAKRLDECLAEWGPPAIDVMKMDVEGYEPKVLAGGAEALSRGVVKHLITEVNGHRLGQNGSSPADLVAQLASLGFRPAELRRGRATVVDSKTWDLDPAGEYDRLFVHRTTEPTA